MTIDTKAQSYALYERGRFGNKLRTWSRLGEIAPSGFQGRVVMRYKGRHGGAAFPRLGEQITLAEAAFTLRMWEALGAREEEVAYNEAAPDDLLVLQGEVTLSTEHLSLFWADEKTTMRRALVHGRQWQGLRALALLRSRLFPSSWADLEALLELYPSSVIEFSAYRVPVGNLPGRNAVIWEVRDY